MIATISTSICAQIQGLWISAFFNGRLDRLPGSLEQAQWQSTLHSQFGRWRYPCGYGARFPDFVFDAVLYVDMLLRDVNLEPHHKKGRSLMVRKTTRIYRSSGRMRMGCRSMSWNESRKACLIYHALQSYKFTL